MRARNIDDLLGKHISDKEYMKLESIEIDDEVSNIPAGSFYELDNLKSVYIPKNVKYIYSGVLRRCENLESVVISEGVVKIGSSFCGSCRKLSSITIPKSVEELGACSFNGCTNLASIKLDARVIGYESFRNCKALSSITIGQNVQSIGVDIFEGCRNVKKIVVDNNNEYYDSRDNCNAIIDTQSNTMIYACNASKIPDGVKVIPYEAFRNCGRMRKIFLPNSLESIGYLPISLQTIIIPKGSKEKFKKLIPHLKHKIVEQ